MPVDFKTVNVGKKPFDFRNNPTVLQLRPIELHHKEDGDLNNNPSFCIVLGEPRQLPNPILVVGQISLAMLNEAMNELGYKIEKL